MYAEQGAVVRTFVHRRVDPAVADDVVADVFLVAWRRFDGAPAEILPLLFGIARGILANQRRAQARRSALHGRLLSSVPREQPAAGLGPADEASPVLQACASLVPRDQEILLLVAWDGLDRDQAARVLGISKAQFALRLHRARRRIQRALEHQPQEPAPTLRRSPSEVS
jgi:RNA polymerase sigma-70 factor, ECF subfamily